MNNDKKQLSQSPWALFWRHLRRNPMAVTGGAILFVFYTLALFAEFFAPYGMETQERSLFYCPPTRLRFKDSTDTFHLRPFVYEKTLVDRKWTKYGDDTSKIYPLRSLLETLKTAMQMKVQEGKEHIIAELSHGALEKRQLMLRMIRKGVFKDAFDTALKQLRDAGMVVTGKALVRGSRRKLVLSASW